MTNKATVRLCVPSWGGVKSGSSSAPSYSVVLLGATESIDGGTQIKKNEFPSHSCDYDARCDSQGNLSGEYPLSNVEKVYIWGHGYTLNGSYYECEPEYDRAAEIEIEEDTEIILWGANIEP